MVKWLVTCYALNFYIYVSIPIAAVLGHQMTIQIIQMYVVMHAVSQSATHCCTIGCLSFVAMVIS
jgi:hypothetical protein